MSQMLLKNKLVEAEEKILVFWEKEKVFEQSVQSRPETKPFVFYDGPPFATGLPHYGHIVASTIKDMIPRFWTMRGFRVERKWGWDCHGLPIENLIEKKLGLTTREKLSAYGIDKFNEACRASVLEYAEEWKKVIRRLGRWADMEHDYKTMDRDYMESVWWVFRQLWDAGLVEEGRKAMHICPRCATPLSNFEVTLNYADVRDLAVIVKFPICDEGFLKKYCGGVKTNFIAWTTTPWSVPTTMALAVGSDIDYVVLRFVDEQVVCAKERLEYVAREKKYEIVCTLEGNKIVHIPYEHPFAAFYRDHPDVAGNEKIYKTYATEYVATDEGTGIVTINGAFGETDMEAAKKIGLPIVVNVSMEGTYTQEMRAFAGQAVKPKENPQKMDEKIADYLEEHGFLFQREEITHSYPLCWRCDTPLLNYAATSWFIRVTELKDELLANNKKIHWVPEHIGQKRFQQWLENARDWAVSRNRFWGTPLPLWRADDGDVLCIGSVEELQQRSGIRVEDLHKHIVDSIVLHHDGKEYHRVSEVLDCWFESGSVPYGQVHYPFADKEKFEASFPADFIAEGQDQTRGWFYTLHVLATALTRGKDAAVPTRPTPAFQNVIVSGIVLAEDGKKMSKRLQNYPDPMAVMEKYGADSLRYYFATSPVMLAESLNFREADVAEIHRKFFNTLWNVLQFYEMFVTEKDIASITAQQDVVAQHILDRWILAKLHALIKNVTAGYSAYHLPNATRPLLDFVQELSTWYVRRCRDRFKQQGSADRVHAERTLATVLRTFARVAAPVVPFIAETIFHATRRANDPVSVHLADWPEVHAAFIDEQLFAEMHAVRTLIEQVLAMRASAGIKVRQPLASVTIPQPIGEALTAIVADELNVKAVHVGHVLALDTTISDALRQEGMLRELIRQTNALRKKEKFTVHDRIVVTIQTESTSLQDVVEKFRDEYQQRVLANSTRFVAVPQEHPIQCNGEECTMTFRRQE